MLPALPTPYLNACTQEVQTGVSHTDLCAVVLALHEDDRLQNAAKWSVEWCSSPLPVG